MHEVGDWMLGWWLAIVIAWITPFFFLYLALRDSSPSRQTSARELLDQAYAQGKLSRDEYLRKREDLAN